MVSLSISVIWCDPPRETQNTKSHYDFRTGCDPLPDEPQPSDPPIFYVVLLGTCWVGPPTLEDLSVTLWEQAGKLLGSCWALAGMLLSCQF